MDQSDLRRNALIFAISVMAAVVGSVGYALWGGEWAMIAAIGMSGITYAIAERE